MRSFAHSLSAALVESRALTFCRLVETRGSTPQKAGAAMVVFDDGQQIGTLGGGCVEAEVKRQAIAALLESSPRPRIVAFDLDHDYGWDDGLICGGRMRILLHPLPVGSPDRRHVERWTQAIASAHAFTDIVVMDSHDVDPPAAAWWIVDAQGAVSSAAPEGRSLPPAIRERLKPLSTRPRTYVAGGVAFLPTLGRCRLVIVGGGHVGQAVAELGHQLDFDVWVVDDRESIVSAERFPHAQRRIAGPIDKTLPDLEITADTYVLVMTRGHQHDEQALGLLCQRGARYVGLIGSRRKIRLIFDDLMEQGIPRETLAQVFAPLGIAIGSQTVPEIAVSICAELIAHRNLQGRIPGRPSGLLDGTGVESDSHQVENT